MHRLRWMAALALIAILAGCSSRYIPPQPSKPSLTKYPTKCKPYTVMGRTYYPMADAAGYDEVGTASWYGRDFHGKPTATGETYNMYGLSAAHKTLPLGTRVRVINLANHHSVELVVNDRGPFVGTRLIDLSYGAAKRLGLVDKGVGTVRITAVDTRIAPVRGTPMKQAAGTQALYHVRVGAFVDPSNAQRVLQQLKDAGYGGARIRRVDRNGTLFHVVQAGSFASRAEADRLLRAVKRHFPTSYIAM